MHDTGSPPIPASARIAGTRSLGAILVVASAAFFALAGIFTRSISSDPLVIACWRGLVGGLLVACYVLWRSGPHGLRLDFGWRGWAMVAVGALSSIAFIGAFKLTYVANVAIIYAAAPLVAAALERAFLKVRLQPITLAMSLVSLLGVAIIVSGAIGGGNLLGDFVAVLMTVGSAVYLVMIRAFRETPVVWVGAVAAFVLFAAGWLVADPLAVAAADVWRMAGFGIAFAFAVILWTEGTRLISAAESGLLGAAEVPFAILFAWIFLAELPPLMSIAGGAVVLVAVIVHALYARRSTPAAPADF